MSSSSALGSSLPRAHELARAALLELLKSSDPQVVIAAALVLLAHA